ncbi:MAG: DNA-binding transcriptional regulator YiaG [Myxococcota bacterium]|jgi:DNA-binding transcriptional regulator YiaG
MSGIGYELAGQSGLISTSAMSPLGARQAVMVVLATGAFTMSTTSSNSDHRLLANAVVMGAQATSAGGAMHLEPTAEPHEPRWSARDGLTELRRVSGLTWDQVARLFSVSRRSVHYWASGKPMTSEHEEHLHRLLALIRGANTSADALRGALLSVVDGEPVLESLASRRYSAAELALRAVKGSGAARPSKPRTPLSASASDARRPLPVDVLAAGEVSGDETVEGRGRAVRTRRSKGRGES